MNFKADPTVMRPNRPVAVLVDEFPSLSETFIVREVDALAAAGVPTVLYALRVGSPPVLHGMSRAHLEGVRYLPIAGSLRDTVRAWRLLWRTDRQRALRWLGRMSLAGLHAPRMTARLLRHLPAVAVLGRDAFDGRIGFIQAHFASLPAEVAWSAAVFGGCAYGISTHARDLFTQPSSLLKFKIRRAALVTACTATHRDFLLHLVPPAMHARIMLAYHGVNIPDPPLSHTERPANNLILSVGRLVPKKAFDVLLSACALLTERQVEYKCQIVGEGPEKKRLADMLRDLKLEAAVNLSGAVMHEHLNEFYDRATVVVVTSRVMPDGDRDGIPNVLLEAMARGIPVVAADTPSMREVIKDGVNGCLLPPEDPARLADTLSLILGDAERREGLGKMAAETVRQHFDAVMHARKLAGRLKRAFLSCADVE